jgi:hypothetical protein
VTSTGWFTKKSPLLPLVPYTPTYPTVYATVNFLEDTEVAYDQATAIVLVTMNLQCSAVASRSCCRSACLRGCEILPARVAIISIIQPIWFEGTTIEFFEQSSREANLRLNGESVRLSRLNPEPQKYVLRPIAYFNKEKARKLTKARPRVLCELKTSACFLDDAWYIEAQCVSK